MRESRSTVMDFKTAAAVQKRKPRGEVDGSSRFPITEAVIRLFNCKLTDDLPLETYADVIAWALFQKGFKGDMLAFKEIRQAVEGPVAQQIYESLSSVDMLR
jgi:hypothetical protein